MVMMGYTRTQLMIALWSLVPQTLERMTNAYVDKYMKSPPGANSTYMGQTTPGKTLSPDDLEAMLGR